MLAVEAIPATHFRFVPVMPREETVTVPPDALAAPESTLVVIGKLPRRPFAYQSTLAQLEQQLVVLPSQLR